MSENRVLWIDIAKGVAMLAVVLGHTYYGGMPAHTFVYSFHVPLFFILSGYTFRVKSGAEVIKKSAKQLLLPYIVLAMIIAMYWLTRGWLNEETVLQFFAGIVFASGGASLPMGIYPIGIPWFLMALFISRILYNAMLGFLQRFNVHMVVQVVLFAFLAWSASKAAECVALPFAFWQSVIAMFFIHIGYTLRRLDLAERAPIPLTVTCLAIWVVSLVFDVAFSIGNLWFGASFVIGAIMAVAASWCVMQACRFIGRHMRRIGGFLAFVGVNSLLVLELHAVEFRLIPWTDVAIESIGWLSPVVMGAVHIAFVLCLLALVVLSPLKMGQKDSDG